MTILRDELHVHLHGCVDAGDLWLLGRDRQQELAPRLAWYESEYEKVLGRRPDSTAYWQDETRGPERLARDFEMHESGSFSQFQARFNLLIALLPITASDTTTLVFVLRKQRSQGVRYGEYRCFVPPLMPASDLVPYFTTMAKACCAIEGESGGAFIPRLAFSLSRTPATFSQQYEALRSALAASNEATRAIVAIDLCGVETPPRAMAALMARFHSDNAAEPSRALAMLYHVGETCEGISLASAARWVAEAQALGAHRLGHALGLGLDPDAIQLDKDMLVESVGERRDHLHWLLAHQDALAEHGYLFSARDAHKELTRLADVAPRRTAPIASSYDTRADTRRLQEALLGYLSTRSTIIESCPTSNLRLGRIARATQHPLRRFLRAGLAVTVGADDPGVFATTLAKEEQVCREVLGVDEAGLHLIARTAESVRAAQLVRGDTGGLR